MTKKDKLITYHIFLLWIAIWITAIATSGCGQLDSVWPQIDCGHPVLSPYAKWEPINEEPVVNVPIRDRQANWTVGNRKNGSCTWATAISLLRWQGEYRMAAKLKRMYGGGETSSSHAKKMEAANVRFAYVTNGDVKFLEWACSTRRGCGITVKGGRHMVALVHLDDKKAGILDNNNVNKIIWVPRASLIAEWRASYGWAVTPVYSPASPLPARPINALD